MGKLSRGFLGAFKASWVQPTVTFGDLLKAMPRKVKRPPTEAQFPVQLKFTLMNAFVIVQMVCKYFRRRKR